MRSKFILVSILSMLYSIFIFSQSDKAIIDFLREGYWIEFKKVEGKSTGWQPRSDELVFTDNGIVSKIFKSKEKFKLSEYSMKPRYKENETIIIFEATGKNKGGSILHWSGMVDGSKIEGTLKWTNQSGTQFYTFSGGRK
ncbi:MAG: hypothetical protein EYC69_12350 [Bacteroidetes bacterium]|nr:MAG: hypothetical protein EYC69_12350 [Bacteroidota bacterium]